MTAMGRWPVRVASGQFEKHTDAIALAGVDPLARERGGASRRRRPTCRNFESLELGRNLVKGAAEAAADVRHGGNRGNGNERGN